MATTSTVILSFFLCAFWLDFKINRSTYFYHLKKKPISILRRDYGAIYI